MLDLVLESYILIINLLLEVIVFNLFMVLASTQIFI